MSSQEIVEEVADDQIRLPLAAVDNATPKYASRIPLQIDRTTPAGLRTPYLHPARRTARLVLLHHVQRVLFQLGVFRDLVPEALPARTVNLDESLHECVIDSYCCRNISSAIATAAIFSFSPTEMLDDHCALTG